MRILDPCLVVEQSYQAADAVGDEPSFLSQAENDVLVDTDENYYSTMMERLPVADDDVDAA